MRTSFFAVLAIALSSCNVNAQKTGSANVPQEITSAFSRLYPNATKVQWEKEGDKYEAGFKDGKQEISVLFDASGKLLETETEIQVKELPSAVPAYVSQKYPGKKIKEAAKITDARGSVTYEAEVAGTDLIFDTAGNFLREAKEK